MWALVVGVASVTRVPVLGGAGGGVELPLDLVFHFIGYAILAALLVRARTPVLVAVLLAAVFGAGIEGIQTLLHFRTASLIDAVMNLIGGIAGGLLATRVGRLSGSPTVREP